MKIKSDYSSMVFELSFYAAFTDPGGHLLEYISSLFKKLIPSNSVATQNQSSTHVSAMTFEALIAKHSNTHIPKQPSPWNLYVEELNRTIISLSSRTQSPNFFANMASSTPHFMGDLAQIVVSINQNMVKSESSKSLTLLEKQTLGMLHRLVFNEKDSFYDENLLHRERTLGIVNSGGTLSNITALWCARNKALKTNLGKSALSLEESLQSLGYSKAVIIGSSSMHYSFDKAADQLGIGSKNLIKIPHDRFGKIDLAKAEEAIQTCIAEKALIIALVGIAGTTDAGAIDPLLELSQLARAYKLHFHVDAAWGGPLLFSQVHKSKLSGIELADTVTLDGHKQFYTPLGVGILLFQDPVAAAFIEQRSSYLGRSGSYDLGKRSIEGSRMAMSLFLHAALSVIGTDGYEFIMNGNASSSKFMAKLIKESVALELLLEPETNIILYRYIPSHLRSNNGNYSFKERIYVNQINEKIHKIQRDHEEYIVSRTTVSFTESEQVALRVILSNPTLQDKNIIGLLDDQIRIGTLIEKEWVIEDTTDAKAAA